MKKRKIPQLEHATGTEPRRWPVAGEGARAEQGVVAARRGSCGEGRAPQAAEDRLKGKERSSPENTPAYRVAMAVQCHKSRWSMSSFFLIL
jgi:hypothetical protein